MRKLYYNYCQSTGAHIIDDGENEIAQVFASDDPRISREEADRAAQRIALNFAAAPELLERSEFLQWLLGELHAGNEFGKEQLWAWLAHVQGVNFRARGQ